MDLFKLVDDYQALLEKKEQLAEETKSNNAAIDTAKKELAEIMIDNECPRVSRGGYAYSLQDVVKYNKKAGADELLFELLKENGLGDIIKETVDARTLSSTIKEMVEEEGLEPGEVPEGFEEAVSAYQFYDISRRKETNKNAQKANSKKAV